MSAATPIKSDGKARQRQVVDPELGEPEPLGEGADADLLEVGRRKADADGAPGARERRDRNEQAGEADRRNERDAGRAEHRRHLRANNGRHQKAKPGRRAHAEQAAGDERRPGALDRHAEDENRQQDERREAQDADQDVRKLLAEQEFDARHRSRAEVGDRAGFHLAHDAERRHDRGDEDQHHHDGAGHLRIDALERLIVAVALLDIDQRERRGFAGQARRQVGEIALHHAAEIAARRLGPERHVAADPGADLRRLLGDQVVAEVRRDLDGEFEIAAAQPGHDLIGGREVWLPVEIFRVLEAVQKLPALERPVLIEDRPAQMLDVERDAVADGEHQDDRIEERKGDPHRVAHDLHRFAGARMPRAAVC